MVEIKLCKRGHPRTPDNVDSRGTCKVCHKEIHKPKYRKKNAKKIIEYNKKYVEENQEIYRAASRNWRRRNPGKVRDAKKRNNAKAAQSRRDRLSDGYIRRNILGLGGVDVPKEIIECKRLNLAIQRELRDAKH